MTYKISTDKGRPSPAELWAEAKGDRDTYRALLVEHGHLIPLRPGEAREPLPCGWPKPAAAPLGGYPTNTPDHEDDE